MSEILYVPLICFGIVVDALIKMLAVKFQLCWCSLHKYHRLTSLPRMSRNVHFDGCLPYKVEDSDQAVQHALPKQVNYSTPSISVRHSALIN